MTALHTDRYGVYDIYIYLMLQCAYTYIVCAHVQCVCTYDV